MDVPLLGDRSHLRRLHNSVPQTSLQDFPTPRVQDIEGQDIRRAAINEMGLARLFMERTE